MPSSLCELWRMFDVYLPSLYLAQRSSPRIFTADVWLPLKSHASWCDDTQETRGEKMRDEFLHHLARFSRDCYCLSLINCQTYCWYAWGSVGPVITRYCLYRRDCTLPLFSRLSIKIRGYPCHGQPLLSQQFCFPAFIFERFLWKFKKKSTAFLTWSLIFTSGAIYFFFLKPFILIFKARAKRGPSFFHWSVG